VGIREEEVWTLSRITEHWPVGFPGAGNMTVFNTRVPGCTLTQERQPVTSLLLCAMTAAWQPHRMPLLWDLMGWTTSRTSSFCSLAMMRAVTHVTPLRYQWSQTFLVRIVPLWIQKTEDDTMEWKETMKQVSDNDKLCHWCSRTKCRPFYKSAWSSHLSCAVYKSIQKSHGPEHSLHAPHFSSLGCSVSGIIYGLSCIALINRFSK
jgi:hypothetical protein